MRRVTATRVCASQDWETTHYAPFIKNFSYDDTHVKAAETIARVSMEEGVSNFVHVSALAADHYAISEWAQSKARGEEAVRAVAPGATIVRPADVFGAEDRFLNMFARLHQTMNRIPLVDGGTTRVQPLFVEDLARAIQTIASVRRFAFLLPVALRLVVCVRGCVFATCVMC